jgi:hypothetical protein
MDAHEVRLLCRCPVCGNLAVSTDGTGRPNEYAPLAIEKLPKEERDAPAQLAKQFLLGRRAAGGLASLGCVL